MAQAFLVGRILVGCYYLQSAFHHFTAVGPMSRAAAAHGVPAPELAIIVAGVLLLVAGLSFLLGVLPQVGVGAIVLFLVPVTLIMHAFWADRDPAHVAPGRVDAAGLDVGDPGRVDVGDQAERFLAQLHLPAELADCLGEADLWFFSPRHLRKGICLPPPRP